MRARFRQISFSDWKLESAVFRSFRLADYMRSCAASDEIVAFGTRSFFRYALKISSKCQPQRGSNL